MLCALAIFTAGLLGIIVGVAGLYVTIMYQCHILENGEEK